MIAERKARVSPRKSSEAGFVGKGCARGFRDWTGRSGSVGDEEEVRSLEVTSRMPMKEARTPSSLRMVNFSVWVRAPMRRVQIEEVEVRIVVDATVVYCKQAMAK